jgi:putative endonuclease
MVRLLVFTTRYGLKRSVYFDRYEEILAASHQEKSLKKLERAWKVRLVEKDSPGWGDLYPGLF